MIPNDKPKATKPLSTERLTEIAAREQAATPGPWCTDSWEIYQGAEYEPGISYWIGETCRADEENDGRADAEFVAHAREDVPALLTEIDRLREFERRVTDELEEFEDAAKDDPNTPRAAHLMIANLARAVRGDR